MIVRGKAVVGITMSLLAFAPAAASASGAAIDALLATPQEASAPDKPARPGPCRVEVSESRIDYGAQTAGQLAQGADGQLYFSRRVLPISVTCPTRQPIALRLVAPRGPGGTPKFANDGAVAVLVSQARLDGRPATLVNQRDPGWPAEQLNLEAGDVVRFRGLDATSAGRTLNALVTIAPRLSAAEARVRDTLRVEANIAFDVVTVDP